MVSVDATALLTEEVRELVRRGAVDPAVEPEAVRSLVAAAVAEYEDRSLTSGLPPLLDRRGTAGAVWDAVAGFGPLQRYLDDPEVEEIWVNDPGKVFVARRGRSELTTTILAPGQVADLVERMLRSSGRRLDVSQPFVDALLPDGSRLHVVIPDITRRHWAVNIRKFLVRASSLDELVGLGTLTHACARFLDAAVVSGLNILVAGGTQAGKTTMLGCLVGAVPARERVVSCEEVFELRLPSPDWVAMQTRQPSLEGTGEVRLRRLVVEALRMRPDRIIVGEVRSAEALDLLLALNSGLPGMCTLHANSAREAVVKLCTLPLLAGENISSSFVIPTVASAVDLVVHLRKHADGQRRVTEVLALPGRVEGEVIEAASVFGTVGGRLVRAEGYPPHADRFADAGFEVRRLLADEPVGTGV